MGEHPCPEAVYCDGQYIFCCGVTGRPGVEKGEVWADMEPAPCLDSENNGGDADDDTGVSRDESHAAGRLNDETGLKGVNSKWEEGCEASASEESARSGLERPSDGGGATWTSMAA
jgi:hypothetical protein